MGPCRGVLPDDWESGTYRLLDRLESIRQWLRYHWSSAEQTGNGPSDENGLPPGSIRVGDMTPILGDAYRLVRHLERTRGWTKGPTLPEKTFLSTVEGHRELVVELAWIRQWTIRAQQAPEAQTAQDNRPKTSLDRQADPAGEAPPQPPGADADLAAALDYDKQCASYLQSLDTQARPLLQTDPPVGEGLKTQFITIFKQTVPEAWSFVWRGQAVLDPVKNGLTAAVPGTAGFQGAHAANAHEALRRLLAGVLETALVYTGANIANITEDNYRQICQETPPLPLDKIYQLRARAEEESAIVRLCRKKERALADRAPQQAPSTHTQPQAAVEQPPSTPAETPADGPPPEQDIDADAAASDQHMPEADGEGASEDDAKPKKKPRPARARDHEWPRWSEEDYPDKKNVNGKTRDRWNELTNDERKAISPTAWQRLSTGKKGWSIVAKGIEAARKDLQSEEPKSGH